MSVYHIESDSSEMIRRSVSAPVAATVGPPMALAHRRRWLPPLGHQWPTHHTSGVLSGLVHNIMVTFILRFKCASMRK